MFKAIAKFLLVFTLLFAVVYGYGYWKINDGVEKAFVRAQSFADVRYASVSLGFNGRVNIYDIRVFIPANGIAFTVDSATFSVGGLWRLLWLENNLLKFKIPEKAEVKLVGFHLPINKALLRETTELVEEDRLFQLSRLACQGKRVSVFQRLRDLGYSEISADIELGYDFDEIREDLNSYWLAKIESLAEIEIYAKQNEALGILTDFRSTFERKNTFDSLRYNQSDLGYNARFIRDCAQNRKLSDEEWLRVHYDALVNALAVLEVDINEEIKSAYKAYLSPGSRFSLAVSFPPATTFEHFGWYAADDVPDLLGIEMAVNDQTVPVSRLGWNPVKWSDPTLRLLAKTPKPAVPTSSAGVAVGKSNPAPSALDDQVKRSHYRSEYHLTSPENLRKYDDHVVRVRRKDGKTFEGKLERFDGKRYWLAVASGAGTATLPVKQIDILEASVLR